MLKCRYIDRGKRDTVVLIPGWATDYRIFDALDIEYNYLVPLDYSPDVFGDGFAQALKENGLKKVSLLGWSMGGFVACDLLARYRELVKDVYLVSVRRRYDKNNNEMIKTVLAKNKKGFLHTFYADCFADRDRNIYHQMKAGLLKEYRDNLDLDRLLDGLDYLSTQQIEPQSLAGTALTFIHGTADAVAPMSEALSLKDELRDARFISIEGTGHMPFLSADFKGAFNDARMR
jgi:pimeloyl-ACP methyl ester carboxylesterase